MITVSILYPNTKGSRFDKRYYLETHMPQSIKLLSVHPGFRSVRVEFGVVGAALGIDPTYVAMCHFESTRSRALWQPSRPMRLPCRATCPIIPISNPSFSSTKY